MRVANVMFGRELGGIEQAFLDYNEALRLAGHEVLAITHPLASINPQISGAITYRSLHNLGSWDIFSSLKLRKVLKDFAPHATITHGNRALKLTRRVGGVCGLHIGVTHNYNLKYFNTLDLVFATTKDLQRAAVEAGATLTHIVRVPNMVPLPPAPLLRAEKPAGETLIIGAMGRMVAKKGFDHLLQAAARLKILTRQPFRIIIGGDGEERDVLQAMVKKLKLEDCVEMRGWINDKTAFYQGCDIFCLPSLHEPFGIVLLEAMAHGVPVVAYESEGPQEIFAQHPDAALLVKLGDIGALAETLSRLLHNPAQRKFLAQQSRDTVEREYALPVVSQKINNALQRFIHV